MRALTIAPSSFVGRGFEFENVFIDQLFDDAKVKICLWI